MKYNQKAFDEFIAGRLVATGIGTRKELGERMGISPNPMRDKLRNMAHMSLLEFDRLCKLLKMSDEQLKDILSL